MKKTIKLFSLLAAIALSGLSMPALADTAPAAAATPAAPTVTVDGMVDGYYTYNFTNSSNNSDLIGNNGTFFNNSDNSYSLGLAEASFTATQGPASGHVVLAYGQESALGIGSVNPTTAIANPGFDVLQAYVSYNPDQWTINAGKFVTWMGNEVIESKSNMNYSRSLLFWYTIPLWHTGISVNYAPSSQFGVTGYITDGWNTTGSSLLGKTYGLQASIKPDSTWSIILNGIAGPGWFGSTPTNYGAARYVGEAIISYVPNSSWSFALDAEYGGQDLVGSNAPLSSPATLGNGSTVSSASFWGVDLYGRYQIQSDWAVALRLEEVEDTYGIFGIYGINNFALYPSNGPYDLEAREATLTVEHNFTTNLLVRLEGRMDMAYTGGSQLSSTANTSNGLTGPFAGASGSQFTTTLGAVFSY